MNEAQAERMIAALERLADVLENLQVSVDSIDNQLERVTNCVVDVEDSDADAIQIWSASE